MNKSFYFKYSNEEGELGSGFCYLEAKYTQDDLTVFRQLEVDDEKFIASNRITGYEQYYAIIDGLPSRLDKALADWPPSPKMCDQPIQDFAPSANVPEIRKEEFDFEWNRYLSTTMHEWRLLKKNNPLESVIQGKSCIFYPQGVLIYLNSMFFGIIDYQKYTTYFGNHLNIEVQTLVQGYDELNQWLLLDVGN
jgi:hypothetical protein